MIARINVYPFRYTMSIKIQQTRGGFVAPSKSDFLYVERWFIPVALSYSSAKSLASVILGAFMNYDICQFNFQIVIELQILQEVKVTIVSFFKQSHRPWTQLY